MRTTTHLGRSTSHGGVLSLFESEVVVEGDAPREHGRFLNLLSELRKKADYGYGSIEEDVDALLERTREFVSGSEGLVGGDRTIRFAGQNCRSAASRV